MLSPERLPGPEYLGEERGSPGSRLRSGVRRAQWGRLRPGLPGEPRVWQSGWGELGTRLQLGREAALPGRSLPEGAAVLPMA